MNTKMLEYEAKKVLEWALREREKQGTETARLSIRKNIKAETGCSWMHYEEIRDYLQGMGVAFFRTGPSTAEGRPIGKGEMPEVRNATPRWCKVLLHVRGADAKDRSGAVKG